MLQTTVVTRPARRSFLAHQSLQRTQPAREHTAPSHTHGAATMRTSVLLLVALLAVASHGVSAQRREKAEKGFTALWSVLDGSIDDASCGMDGQVCCKDFKCKEAGSGCVPLQSQRPTCMKCGKGNQPCCPGESRDKATVQSSSTA